MARLLLLVVIGVLGWLLYRTIVGAGRKKSGPPPATKTEDMVACSLCGVNLPKSEAQLIDGAYRCPNGESCVHRTKD